MRNPFSSLTITMAVVLIFVFQEGFSEVKSSISVNNSHSDNVMTTGKDYTFCDEHLSITLFDGGAARMIRFGLAGVVVKTIAGEWSASGSPNDMPGQNIKAVFENITFSFTMIRNGYGIPSVLIDMNGHRYELCNSAESSYVEADPIEKYDQEKKEQERIEKANNIQYDIWAKEFGQKIRIIYNKSKIQAERANIPGYLEDIETRTVFPKVLERFSPADKNLYLELKKLANTIQAEENAKKNPNEYKYPGFLREYTTRNGKTRKLPENCGQIYDASSYNNVVLFNMPKFNGHIIDGTVYDEENTELGILKESEKFYYLTCKVSEGGRKYNVIYLGKNPYIRFHQYDFRGYEVSLGFMNQSGGIEYMDEKFYIKEGAYDCAALSLIYSYINYCNISKEPVAPKNIIVVNTGPNNSTKNVEGEILNVADQMPVFPGGENELVKYLNDNIKYPAAAKEDNVQGKVFVRFCVTSEGAVKNISIFSGINSELDAEASRIVASLPHFSPAINNGVPVNIWYVVTVDFQINK